MFRTILWASIAMTIFMAVPTSGNAGGCKNMDFVGSYTRTEANQDIFGDGSAVHTFIYQLNLHSDGTATQHWTGVNDYLITLGTGSSWRGSWTCRNDGKLVVTLIVATYFPVQNNPNVTSPDVELRAHFRATYLFNVVDENTLTRIQARTRTYAPNQDPGDPTAGNLGPLSTTPLTYNRLVASDADLLVP